MGMTSTKLRLMVASLLVASLLGALDHTVVATSLASIAGELGAMEHMSWIIVAYTLASAVLMPVIGKLGDTLGVRRVFLASLAFFLLASLACGFAQDIVQLVAGRIGQGLGSAGMQLMSQTIVASTTTPRQRPRYLSIIGAAFPVAILVGPVVGGLITDAWGWRWVFWINLPVGVVALLLAHAAVPRLPGRPRRNFDVAGSVLFAVFVGALVLAATWASSGTEALPVVIAATLSVLAFGGFVAAEVRAPEPLVPLGLFGNRTFAVCVFLSTVIGIGLFSVVSYVPTYIQMAYGASATASGLVPIATVFGMLASSLVSGWVASRTGHYRSFPVAGTALAAAGLFTMAMLPTGMPLWVPMAVMGVVGVGTGAFMNIIVAVAQSAARRADVGSATASVNMVRNIGSTVATAVIGSAIGTGVAARLPAALDAATLTPQRVHEAAPAVQGEVALVYADVLGPIFITLAVTYLAGVAAALLLPGGRLADDGEASIPESKTLTSPRPDASNP